MALKAVNCPNCGANIELDDSREFGFCSYCGTKVMQEKIVVEHKGTVKVDNSDLVNNYYEMAKNAYEADNKSEAEKYCNKIIEIDPKNYNAWLLKGKAAGWLSSVSNIRIKEAINCFSKAVEFSPESEDENIKNELMKEISDLICALIKHACNNFISNPIKINAAYIINSENEIFTDLSLFNEKCGLDIFKLKNTVASIITKSVNRAFDKKILSDYKSKDYPSYYDLKTYLNRADSCVALLTSAELLYYDQKEEKISIYKTYIKIYSNISDAKSYYNNGYGMAVDHQFNKETKIEYNNKIMEYHNKIKKLKPSYEIPAQQPVSSNGCYVATAVYGSYDCPQVWTLRRYRDLKLAKSIPGRAFIKMYYAVSPTVVKWFGRKVWFNKMWRGKLDKMVEKLQAQGYEDSPYSD